MTYITLEKMEVYILASELSSLAWNIYKKLDFQIRKIIGDQFISAVDSIGANIAEGYGRFHYMDKVKFYYNARGSLLESRHWLNLLSRRKMISIEDASKFLQIYEKLWPCLNALIKAVTEKKNR